MGNELTGMESATKSIGTAAAAFEQAKAKLYDGNGQPIFAPEALDKRLTEALTPLQAATAMATSIAKTNAQWAVSRREALIYSDPAADLAPADLAAASQRATFVREDVQNLSFSELAARVRAAVANTDRVGVFLLARYGLQKIRDLEEQQRSGRPLDPYATRGLTEAVDELGKLADFLQPKRKADLEGLDQIIAKGIELQDFARRTIQTADGSDQQRRAEYAARMRSW
jgi:hypothetical protein